MNRNIIQLPIVAIPKLTIIKPTVKISVGYPNILKSGINKMRIVSGKR